ncbi:MAG TPA: hypothetical protein VI072_11475 [Polyangiaceae bacterium]
MDQNFYRRSLNVTLLGIVVSGPLSGCGSSSELGQDAEGETAAQSFEMAIPIDARRSLAITDEQILARFSFRRVLDQLVSQSGVPGLTALSLFQQWWDTQNPGPGLGLGPHCDDTTDANGLPTLNGFPYDCRPAPSEGIQAQADPFAEPLATNPDAYIPVGLFMRPDLARQSARSCGEYRIVYAKRSGITNNRDRNLIIFEAALSNPRPDGALLGCKPLAAFLANLSSKPQLNVRATDLERLFFTGVNGFPPAIHVTHFGDNAFDLGQIRTNQFINITPSIWTLREFKLVRHFTGSTPDALQIVPVTVKNNPFGPLMGASDSHALTPEFQESQASRMVHHLSVSNFAAESFAFPDPFNSGQSHASASTENNYVLQFASAPESFRSELDAALAARGSTLTATNIIQRAQALSCAGCHRLNNNMDVGGGVTWPRSLGFTHVTENATEIVGGSQRFVLSEAMVNAFLPERVALLKRLVTEVDPRARTPQATFSGRETH